MQSNENFDLRTSDDFAAAFDQFQASGTFERLQEKFRLKPYFERNKTLRAVTVGASYFLNTFSVSTAFFCVFAFLQVIVPAFLAGGLALIGLAGLEALKRLTIPGFFQRFFQFRTIAVGSLAVIALLVALSVVLSYKGAADAVLALTKAPELVDVEAVRAPYVERIADLEAQKADLKKTSTYQGVYTAKGAKALEGYNNRLAALEAELSEKVATAEATNATTKADHIATTGVKAEYFAVAALILDLLLILALAWSEYYDYRSLAEFAKAKGKTAAQQQTSAKNDGTQSVADAAFEAIKVATRAAEDAALAATAATHAAARTARIDDPTHLNGNGQHHHSNGATAEAERITITGFASNTQRNASDAMRKGEGAAGQVIDTGLKQCEHCAQTFRPKTVWQRFCTTQCREDNWQTKTGKTLKRRGKSQVFNSMLMK
jgi:hypothetical protein